MGTATAEFYRRQVEVLERVARGDALSEVLDQIVRLIEGQSGGMLCSLLLVDVSSKTVRHVAAPNLPQDYVRALDGSRIGPAAGSCGTAAYRGERVVVEDIANDPLWESYRHLALPHGIRACWSSPIFSPQREVLGTFAMYHREPRAPTRAELEWVDAATHLAAVAIQHDRAQRALCDAEARASQLAKLYAVSSSVNEAIVRLRDPGELYACACRIAVEQGLARLAWVGLLEPTSGVLQPVARFGADEGYVDRIVLSLRDERTNRGPAGKALSSGAAAWCNDIAADPDFFWKEEALARGLAACAVIPLHISGRVAGAFALYTSQAHSFQEEEMRVLETLAGDISFAVESAQVERERNQLLWELGERVKELTLLHQTARLLQSDPPLEQLLSRLVALIPPAWQYPERCRARIRCAELELETPGFRDGPCKLERTFGGLGERGQIEVVYLERPPGPAAPFLPEEVELLHSLAEMLSAHLGRQQRRRLEAQLQQAQRMQSLGTLAGGIAHDFNNILTAIAGNAELGLAELPPDHGAHESFVEIRKASRRASDLVRQILAFSRQEPAARQVLDVRQLIGEVLQLLGPTLPPGIQLEQALDADTPAVCADGSQLHQVLMNLCTNAVHALQGERGVIRVSSGAVHVDAGWVAHQPELREGRHCRIVVSDTGCGMNTSTLSRAFEPFFTTRPYGQGTGLGLSVVHGIARSHGGAIGVQSAVGQGTSFELYLPAAELPPEEAASEGAAGAGTGEHILYVDDDEALVFLAQRLLPRRGYRVTGYTDPVRALNDFREHAGEFHAVVTDISMPGMSGAELVRELRQLRPDLLIVMTSGYIRDEDLATAQRLGVGDLILKPDSVDDLVGLLQQKLSARVTSPRAAPAS